MVVAIGGMRMASADGIPSGRAAESSLTPNRMAAQALLLLANGHVQAAIGAYRALAARYPERAELCAMQIAAIELLLASDEL